jgi:hypothetical protein
MAETREIVTRPVGETGRVVTIGAGRVSGEETPKRD